MGDKNFPSLTASMLIAFKKNQDWLQEVSSRPLMVKTLMFLLPNPSRRKEGIGIKATSRGTKIKGQHLHPILRRRRRKIFPAFSVLDVTSLVNMQEFASQDQCNKGSTSMKFQIRRKRKTTPMNSSSFQPCQATFPHIVIPS